MAKHRLMNPTPRKSEVITQKRPTSKQKTMGRPSKDAIRERYIEIWGEFAVEKVTLECTPRGKTFHVGELSEEDFDKYLRRLSREKGWTVRRLDE